jgi:hypothetical protein
MVDPELVELARKKVKIQLDQRHNQFRQEVSRVTNEMASRGILYSTIALGKLYKTFADEIDTEASIAWLEFKNVLSAIDVHPSEELTYHLKQDAEKILRAIMNDLTTDLSKLTNSIMSISPQEIDNLIGKLTNTQNKALERINNEIELFVLSLSRAKEKDGPTDSAKNVINVTGNVGAIQTGPNAKANVTQIIGSQDQEALLTALDNVKKYLESEATLPGLTKEEAVELIEESRIEVNKPNPNSTRLKTSLMSIAVSIQTVASLKPAYEVIKSALSYFGFHLPW